MCTLCTFSDRYLTLVIQHIQNQFAVSAMSLFLFLHVNLNSPSMAKVNCGTLLSLLTCPLQKKKLNHSSKPLQLNTLKAMIK